MERTDALIRFPVGQSEDESSGLVEVTVRIREDQACALEAIQLAERMNNSHCDQSELFQQALDLLISERIKAVRLRKRIRN